MIINLQDRLTRGFIAGLAGGIAMVVLDLLSFYVLHFGDERLLDFAAEIIFGHRASSIAQAIVAQGAQFLFAGILGVIFAYSITRIKSVNYLFKGWFYGVSIWFTVYAIARLFGALEDISWREATSDFIVASVFGLVLAETLRWLDQEAAA